MIIGRRKTIRLLLVRVRLSLRNSGPTIGRSPRKGTWLRLPPYSSFSRPPSTMIWPSSTTTVVSIALLSVVRPCGDRRLDGTTLEFSW